MSPEKITISVIFVLVVVVGFVLFQFLGTDDKEIDTIVNDRTEAVEPTHVTDLDEELINPSDNGGAGRETIEPTSQQSTLDKQMGGVFGRVVNKEMSPIEGVVVSCAKGGGIFSAFASSAQTIDIESTTDSQGNYRLTGMNPGQEYSLIAKHPKYADTSKSPVVVRAGKQVELADIVMGDGFKVYGTITSDKGSPIAGATVSLLDPTSGGFHYFNELKVLGEAKTDNAGAYVFTSVSASNFDVRVEAANYGSQTQKSVHYAAKKDKEINFELGPPQSISGHVRDVDERGIAGVTVRASRSMSKKFASSGVAVTGSDGSFVVSNIADGQYVLRATCEGYTASTKQRIVAGVTGVVLVMKEQGGVSGFVRDQRTGNPIEEFSMIVKRHRQGKPSFRLGEEKKFNSPDGAFQLENLDPDAYIAEVEAAGYATCVSGKFTVRRGEIKPGVDIFMNRGGALTGRVVGPKGESVKGAEVTLRFNQNPSADLFAFSGTGDPDELGDSGTKAVTDASGRFTKKLITPGAYQLYVSHPGYVSKFINDLTVVEGDSPIEVALIRLSVGGTVKGKSLDNSGSTLPGAVILLSQEQGYNYKQIISDRDGRFEFNHLEPGIYTVTIQGDPTGAFGGGEEFNPFSQLIVAEKSRVKVRVDEGDVEEIVVRLMQ